MNASHQANQIQKRIRRLVKRLKATPAADRKEKLETRLKQLQ